MLGRVTMDMTMVDVTNVNPRPEVGDEVVLIGTQADHAITVDDVAGWVSTISYEVMTGISKRVARAYIRAGKVEAIKTLLGIVPHNISV